MRIRVIYPPVDHINPDGKRVIQPRLTIELTPSMLGITPIANDERVASAAFAFLQDHEFGFRSAMAGDIFCIGEDIYIALGRGFTKITPEQLEKWEAVPFHLRAMRGVIGDLSCLE